MGCTNKVRRNQFIGYRDIYDTKRDIIECKGSCKAIPKIRKKRKVKGERNIYRAEVLI